MTQKIESEIKAGIKEGKACNAIYAELFPKPKVDPKKPTDSEPYQWEAEMSKADFRLLFNQVAAPEPQKETKNDK